MAHIPLGYKIVDGCAVVDELTVEKIKATYRYYFEGKSLVDAAKEAGFKMNHATVKRMLSNKKYLGTDYYPQIIDEETIERFLEELTRRAGNLGRLDRKCKERTYLCRSLCTGGIHLQFDRERGITHGRSKEHNSYPGKKACR